MIKITRFIGKIVQDIAINDRPGVSWSTAANWMAKNVFKYFLIFKKYLHNDLKSA